ncbi:MAG: hypothetical protein Q8P82_00890, partial [bacterium]|nr:hypothetical protein [bacterium]
LTELQNPNGDWYATFRYQFAVGNELTTEEAGFILPGEKKYIGRFGQTFQGFPRAAQFQLTNLEWHRVDRHVIPDISAWMSERLRFLTTNVTHTTNLQVDSIIGRTSFDIENRTAFGYWRVGTYVVLKRGTVPVAANYFALDQFESGEKRHVDINWFDQLPQSSEVEIRPEVNIFDPDSFLPPRAE